MGTVPAPFHRLFVGAAGLAAFLAVAAVGCGGSDESSLAPAAAPTLGPTAAAAVVAPTQVPTPTPTSTAIPSIPVTTRDRPEPTSTPTRAPTSSPTPARTSTPAPTPTPAFDKQREAGAYEDLTFVVGEGSEATFTVKEQLVRLPLPNDAVMRTTALSGEVHLDGRPSVIKVDLHQLRSDQDFRDRYVRTEMFRDHRFATFTAGDLGELPEAFTRGEVATGSGTGQLEIRGIVVPLSLDIEARDDGNAINILGRSTFTWDEFQIPLPRARSVVSVEDEVSVEVLLVVRPLAASSP